MSQSRLARPHSPYGLLLFEALTHTSLSPFCFAICLYRQR